MCALAKFLNAACQSSGTVIGLFRAGSKFACTVIQSVGAAAELIDAVLQISDILRCCGRLIRQLLQAAAKAGCQLICAFLEGGQGCHSTACSALVSSEFRDWSIPL